MKRREFIGASLAAAAAAGLASCNIGPQHAAKPAHKHSGKLSLRFYPYELQLAHTFTVSSYSRTTTPDVQVEIDFDGITGYGEASMPPYLGHTVAGRHNGVHGLAIGRRLPCQSCD